MKFSVGDHYNQVITIFGRRGSGKTTLCSDIAREYHKLIVYDTRSRIDIRDHAGADTVIPGADKIMGDFSRLTEKIVSSGKKFKIIFTPLSPENDFDLFCELMSSKEINDTLIFIEEIGLLTRASAYGISDSFNKILRFGRHHGLYLLTNAQRPCDVHRSITANSSHIICFSQTEPRDLAYLSGFFGAHTEEIRNLPKYHFLAWHEGEIKAYNNKREEIKNVGA